MLQGEEREVMSQLGINKDFFSKMAAKPFVCLLLGLKLRPFGPDGKMD